MPYFVTLQVSYFPFEPAETTLQYFDLAHVHGFFELANKSPKPDPPAFTARR
jgi:hypothetical protein